MNRYDWNEDRIRDAVEQNYSYTGVLRTMGIKTTGNNVATLQRKIEKYNISTAHFTFASNTHKQRRKIEEYLVQGSTIQTSKLKERLIQEGLKENKCEICGLDNWLGRRIICQLHHINGDNTDNRLENLQILCPNCHSQTENYCGQANKKAPEKHYCEICGRELKSKQATKCPQCSARNRGKMKLDKEEFIGILKKHKGNRVQAAKELGISETAVRKWCKTFGLPTKSKDLKATGLV